jgi:hypothetical protein
VRPRRCGQRPGARGCWRSAPALRYGHDGARASRPPGRSATPRWVRCAVLFSAPRRVTRWARLAVEMLVRVAGLGRVTEEVVVALVSPADQCTPRLSLSRARLQKAIVKLLWCKGTSSDEL